MLPDPSEGRGTTIKLAFAILHCLIEGRDRRSKEWPFEYAGLAEGTTRDQQTLIFNWGAQHRNDAASANHGKRLGVYAFEFKEVS